MRTGQTEGSGRRAGRRPAKNPGFRAAAAALGAWGPGGSLSSEGKWSSGQNSAPAQLLLKDREAPRRLPPLRPGGGGGFPTSLPPKPVGDKPLGKERSPRSRRRPGGSWAAGVGGWGGGTGWWPQKARRGGLREGGEGGGGTRGSEPPGGTVGRAGQGTESPPVGPDGRPEGEACSGNYLHGPRVHACVYLTFRFYFGIIYST